MNLLDLPVAFVDCQTTGAHPSRGHLLEIAWQVGSARGWAVPPQAFLARLPDGETVPRKIQTLTGIDDDAMAAALPLAEIRARLARDLPEVAVVHFAQFERPFLEALFAAEGGPFPARLICTHRIVKALLPNLPVKGLRGIAGYFGHRIRTPLKRATGHVEATVRIWLGLVRALEAEGVSTLEQLDLWSSARPVARTRAPYEYPMERAKRLALPDLPGIYRMIAQDGEVLYVGKATSLKSRVNGYFRGRKGRDPRKLEMLTATKNIQTMVCATPLEAALLENDEIKAHDPPYNICLKANGRELLFYARDLRSVVDRGGHGPFSGRIDLKPLQLLASSLEDGAFDPGIFWEPLDPRLLEEGFQVYCDGLARLPASFRTPRSLMAQGLREWRQRVRASRIDEPAPEADDVTEDDVIAEPSPEAVADKYRRLLIRCGRAYGFARATSALLSAKVRFEDRGVQRELGPWRDAGEGWVGLGVVDHDRMKVLLSELSRISSAGGAVDVEPRLRWPILAKVTLKT